MSSDANDELARTATAHDSAPSNITPVNKPGETIGRYRLERTLGVGGMGVVHVAFDPDLERRVALKVLRAATGQDAAKRLQREARAMARLNHTNVVTVHEVGSVAGRDYVAMELIDGETLAEWLRAGKREQRAIIDAFIAAGRGLAAAHAAGIVHRDFKPHNVLRSRAGRIAVTDFGLAREANDPLAVTAASSSATPTSLSGLTVSGSVLGTPAYMAPEQWQGGEVTPSADQFGFCVALWEALTGERPYRGPTIEDLKAQVAEGPQALDDSKIPRRLRSILQRGLDPDRTKRWSSMDELLAQLERARRRSWILLAAVGAAAVAAGVLFFVLRGSPGASACAAPALDPAVVWSDESASAATANGQGVAAKQLTADHRKWRELRTAACKYEPSRRIASLGCLDGVLARFSAVAQAINVQGLPSLDAGALLIDPAVCAGTSVPRLITTVSAPLAEVISVAIQSEGASELPGEQKLAALVERTSTDPCAEALAQAIYAIGARTTPARDRASDLSEQAADRCGDDRIRAEVALAGVTRSLSSDLGATQARRQARAEAAVAHVPQADLNAALAEFKMVTDARNDKIDEALEAGQTAVAGYAARGRVQTEIRAGVRALQIRQTRASQEDVAVIASSLAKWRALAIAELGDKSEQVRSIDVMAAGWAWLNGDVAGAHSRLDALRRPTPNADSVRLRGVVVDGAGAPVSGAIVVAGRMFNGDSVGIALALFAELPSSVRTTTTNADGTFDIPDAVPEGIVVAQLGNLRSDAAAIAPSVKLMVRPTSRLSGTVDPRGLPPTKLLVGVSRHNASGPEYSVVAPVGRDGSFTLDGVPRGDLDVAVVIQAAAGQNMSVKRLSVTEPVVSDVVLVNPATQRMVTVLVRSTIATPAPNGQVMAMAGAQPEAITLKQLSDRFGDLGAINFRLARSLDKTFADGGLGQSGDLAVTLAMPEGPASACGLALPADLQDVPKAATKSPERIELRCVPVPPDAKVVVVKVPPWPRFD